MVSEVLNSYRLTLDYLRRLVADVPDVDLTRQPTGLANHPAWVIGHLAVSCQALGGEMELAPWLPSHWEGMFGTGSVPTADRSVYPPKAELLTVLADAQARLSHRTLVLGDVGMSAPLPDARYRELLPTIGHAVVHILTAHAAVHVGQVSVWRRAGGYRALSQIFV
jgi:hypothetical protein